MNDQRTSPWRSGPGIEMRRPRKGRSVAETHAVIEDYFLDSDEKEVARGLMTPDIHGECMPIEDIKALVSDIRDLGRIVESAEGYRWLQKTRTSRESPNRQRND